MDIVLFCFVLFCFVLISFFVVFVFRRVRSFDIRVIVDGPKDQMSPMKDESLWSSRLYPKRKSTLLRKFVCYTNKKRSIDFSLNRHSALWPISVILITLNTIENNLFHVKSKIPYEKFYTYKIKILNDSFFLIPNQVLLIFVQILCDFLKLITSQ